jgi:hypothetical protein
MIKKILIVISCLLFGWEGVKAQEENTIAIAVYNFTRYIDWPAADAGKNFYIDIIGHKSVFDKLKELTTGRKVGNRDIIVRYLDNVEKITQSDILFLGFWQSKEVAKAMEKIKSSPTLLISEKEGLAEAGAGINFLIVNGTIKFEIKKSNIVKYGLILSETLEKMAYKTY